MGLKKVVKKNLDTPTTKVSSMFTKDEISKMAKEYLDINAQLKVLTDKKSKLSEKIKFGSEQFGVKDDKGSFYLEDNSYIVGKVASKSIKLNEDKTLELITQKGLKKKCYKKETKEVLDEKALEELVTDGTITQDEFNSILDIKVTYKVLVNEKKELTYVHIVDKL